MAAGQLVLQWGISKSAVRQAGNRLEAEGLVGLRLRRGACVRESSMLEIRNKIRNKIGNEIWNKIWIKAGDLDELREGLELPSLAAAAIRPKLLAQRAVSFNRTKAFQVASNRLKRIEQELRFHRRMGRASAKGVLPLATDRLLTSPLAIRVDVGGRPVAF